MAETINGKKQISAYNITVENDIYTVPWTDYSGDSTINGWSSFSTKILNYKRVGKLMFCEYRFFGPGNSTTVNFSMPYSSTTAAYHVFAIGRAADNGVWLTGVPWGRTTGSSTIISLVATQAGGITGSWSGNTGTRIIEGSFWYESL